MLSCKEAAQLLSLKADGVLPWYRRPSLWFHLAMCRWCKCYGKRMAFIASLLRGMDKEEAMDEDLKLSDQARERIRNVCCCGDENKNENSEEKRND